MLPEPLNHFYQISFLNKVNFSALLRQLVLNVPRGFTAPLEVVEAQEIIGIVVHDGKIDLIIVVIKTAHLRNFCFHSLLLLAGYMVTEFSRLIPGI